ncbi:hypothetical protein MASR2M78_08230 [Treponema sp.]
MLGKEIAVRDFTEGESFEREGYTVLTEYSSVDSWSGLKNRWIVEKGAERYEKTFVQRLYSASELRSLLLESGFAEVDLYGDWKGQSYDNAACVLIAVARR